MWLPGTNANTKAVLYAGHGYPKKIDKSFSLKNCWVNRDSGPKLLYINIYIHIFTYICTDIIWMTLKGTLFFGLNSLHKSVQFDFFLVTRDSYSKFWSWYSKVVCFVRFFFSILGSDPTDFFYIYIYIHNRICRKFQAYMWNLCKKYLWHRNNSFRGLRPFGRSQQRLRSHGEFGGDWWTAAPVSVYIFFRFWHTSYRRKTCLYILIAQLMCNLTLYNIGMYIYLHFEYFYHVCVSWYEVQRPIRCVHEKV